jgi:hypothetical protein
MSFPHVTELLRSIIRELGKLHVQPEGYTAPKGFRIKFEPDVQKSGRNTSDRYVATIADMLETAKSWNYPYAPWPRDFDVGISQRPYLSKLVISLGYEEAWLDEEPKRQHMYNQLKELRDTLIARGKLIS